MEQASRSRAHLERVLLISGLQNAGKSTALRRMFLDPRFGTGGNVPRNRRLGFVTISRERCLFFRLSSPHEAGDTLERFFRKLNRAMERAWNFYWRFNFACAMQPHSNGTTADLVTFCEEFQKRLLPERTRVVQIHPRQDGEPGALLSTNDVDRLWALGVEVATIDARRPRNANWATNGHLLADYFDFT